MPSLSPLSDVASQDRFTLQPRIDELQRVLDRLTEEMIQDLTAIQVSADSLLYGFRRGQSFSEERLHASLDLIAIACRQAAERIKEVRLDFPSAQTRNGLTVEVCR